MPGDKVELRPMGEGDAPLIVAWRSNPEVRDQMFAQRGPTLEEHLAWFKRYSAQEDRKEFMICLRDTGEAIGTIGLSGIDPFHRKGEYGILIGASAHRGKGYASEASQLILAYGFKTLKLQKIALRVFAENSAAIRLYEHVGFRREGCLHREFFKEGRFKDVILMAAFDGSDGLAD